MVGKREGMVEGLMEGEETTATKGEGRIRGEILTVKIGEIMKEENSIKGETRVMGVGKRIRELNLPAMMEDMIKEEGLPVGEMIAEAGHPLLVDEGLKGEAGPTVEILTTRNLVKKYKKRQCQVFGR